MRQIPFFLLLLLFSCSSPTDSDTDTECSGTLDCAGICGGTAMEDCLGVCSGTAPAVADLTTGCDLPISSTTGYLYLTSDGSVLYRSPKDMKGFQFVVNGATSTSSVGVSGGVADDAGYELQSQYNSTDGYLVIGFSLTGGIIGDTDNDANTDDGGCGTLTTLSLSSDVITPSLTSPIFAGVASGSQIIFEYYCSGN